MKIRTLLHIPQTEAERGFDIFAYRYLEGHFLKLQIPYIVLGYDDPLLSLGSSGISHARNES